MAHSSLGRTGAFLESGERSHYTLSGLRRARQNDPWLEGFATTRPGAHFTLPDPLPAPGRSFR